MERGLLARRSAGHLSRIGPRVRFFAGLALILGNLLWMFQRDSLTDSDIPDQAVMAAASPFVIRRGYSATL